MRRALRDESNGNRDMPITIAADGAAAHRHVVTALDAASALGFHQLTIAAQAPVDRSDGSGGCGPGRWALYRGYWLAVPQLGFLLGVLGSWCLPGRRTAGGFNQFLLDSLGQAQEFDWVWCRRRHTGFGRPETRPPWTTPALQYRWPPW